MITALGVLFSYIDPIEPTVATKLGKKFSVSKGYSQSGNIADVIIMVVKGSVDKKTGEDGIEWLRYDLQGSEGSNGPVSMASGAWPVKMLGELSKP